MPAQLAACRRSPRLHGDVMRYMLRDSAAASLDTTPREHARDLFAPPPRCSAAPQRRAAVTPSRADAQIEARYLCFTL